MLEETGQPQRTDSGLREAMKSPAFPAIDPVGEVPPLVHGDAVVSEAAAICAYLAQAFRETGLLPENALRARGLSPQAVLRRGPAGSGGDREIAGPAGTPEVADGRSRQR